MPARPIYPKERDIRRTYRSLRKEGVSVDRLIVNAVTGNFAFTIARGEPRPETDVLRELEAMLASDTCAAQGEGGVNDSFWWTRWPAGR
jgi:hypothetical protein